jgi:hypothetical protein
LEPRTSTSEPISWMPISMSLKLPAMVISCTGWLDLAVLDPEASGTTGIVAGDVVDAVAEQFGDQQSAVHLLDAGRPGRTRPA